MGQLEVTWNLEGDTLNLGLKGKLNTLEAMNLDERLSALPEEVKNIFIDFDGLFYIASGGLRILFWASEYTAKKGGKLSAVNISPEVMDILTITGLTGIFSD